MITREEAYIIGESIKVPSMEQRSERIKEFINTVYDSFEQHIKSHEAQLANTEQLTCDRCKFWKDYRKCPMADYENVSPKNYCYNFYPKDTK